MLPLSSSMEELGDGGGELSERSPLMAEAAGEGKGEGEGEGRGDVDQSKNEEAAAAGQGRVEERQRRSSLSSKGKSAMKHTLSGAMEVVKAVRFAFKSIGEINATSSDHDQGSAAGGASEADEPERGSYTFSSADPEKEDEGEGEGELSSKSSKVLNEMLSINDGFATELGDQDVEVEAVEAMEAVDILEHSYGEAPDAQAFGSESAFGFDDEQGLFEMEGDRERMDLRLSLASTSPVESDNDSVVATRPQTRPQSMIPSSKFDSNRARDDSAIGDMRVRAGISAMDRARSLSAPVDAEDPSETSSSPPSSPLSLSMPPPIPLIKSKSVDSGMHNLIVRKLEDMSGVGDAVVPAHGSDRTGSGDGLRSPEVLDESPPVTSPRPALSPMRGSDGGDRDAAISAKSLRRHVSKRRKSGFSGKGMSAAAAAMETGKTGGGDGTAIGDAAGASAKRSSSSSSSSKPLHVGASLWPFMREQVFLGMAASSVSIRPRVSVLREELTR